MTGRRNSGKTVRSSEWSTRAVRLDHRSNRSEERKSLSYIQGRQAKVYAFIKVKSQLRRKKKEVKMCNGKTEKT